MALTITNKIMRSDLTPHTARIEHFEAGDAWRVSWLPRPDGPERCDPGHDPGQALRQQPSIGGTIGLAAVGDDFFVALRVIGSQVSVFLSDLTASVDWPMARQVLDHLDIPVPDDDDDLDQVLPAGDLSIFADLGIDEMELGALSGDLDLFPYDVLEIIAQDFDLPLSLASAKGVRRIKHGSNITGNRSQRQIQKTARLKHQVTRGQKRKVTTATDDKVTEQKVRGNGDRGLASGRCSEVGRAQRRLRAPGRRGRRVGRWPGKEDMR
jgi:putative tRNA adenosine deaminase-associated protein